MQIIGQRSTQIASTQINSLQLFSSEDEFTSQAQKSYGFKLGVGAKFFGGLFFAGVFHGELSDHMVNTGAAFHLGPYDNYGQMSVYFRYAHAGLDPQSEQQFNTLYWNRFPNESRFGLGTIQAMGDHLRTLRDVTDVEVRLPLDGGNSADENLLAVYLNKYDATPLQERFEAVRKIYKAKNLKSPLTPEWEQAARKDYERIFNGGATVDDAAWRSVIHAQLTPSIWKLPFLSAEKRHWVSHYFTQEHIDAYAAWSESREKYKKEKMAEIKSMTFEQKYKAFYESNLFYPNMVYIRKYAGAGDMREYFFGVTVPKPSNPQSDTLRSVADHKLLNKGFGLYKIWASEENLRQNMVGNIAVDLNHIRDYIEIYKKDPALGEAIDFLYNRYGYRRTGKCILDVLKLLII